MKLLPIIPVLLLLCAFTPPYGIGDKVSDFTLQNVDGKTVTLSTYTGNGVIVVFDCNTCPYSKAYNDRIKALHKKYAPQGYPLVAINSNDPEVSAGDSFEQMVSQAKRKDYDFPYLVDETQDVARAFGATNTPHVFVLKRNGKNFEVAYIGAIDNNSRNASLADEKYVEAAVDALLAGKPVATQKTKAVGCGIQWKER
jgi:peroxiredoxin